MRNADHVAVAGGEGADDLLAVVGAGVVDEDDFVADMQLLERLGQSPVHDRDRLAVLVAGDDGRNAVGLVRAELLRGFPVLVEILERADPFGGFGQAVPQRGARHPAEFGVGLFRRRIPLGDVPAALRHGELGIGGQAEEVFAGCGELADGGLHPGADVERFAEVLRPQVQRRIDESLAGVIDIDEVAGDLGIDEIGVASVQALHDRRRHQTGRILVRAEHRIEPQIGARKSQFLAGVMDDPRRGALGDRVMAVGRERHILARAGGVVAVFGRTAGMDVAMHRPAAQFLDQAGGEIDVSAIDQCHIGFERVGTVGDTVEHGARLHGVEQLGQVVFDQQVAGDDALGRNAFEPPGGRGRGGAEHVGAMAQQDLQQVGADEAAGAEYQDRPLQAGRLVGDAFQTDQRVHYSAASRMRIPAPMLSASSPFSRRWNACEP